MHMVNKKKRDIASLKRKNAISHFFILDDSEMKSSEISMQLYLFYHASKLKNFWHFYLYKKIYFKINNTVSTYIKMLIFFSFALPVRRLINVQEITPTAIPSEIL